MLPSPPHSRDYVLLGSGSGTEAKYSTKYGKIQRIYCIRNKKNFKKVSS